MWLHSPVLLQLLPLRMPFSMPLGVVMAEHLSTLQGLSVADRACLLGSSKALLCVFMGVYGERRAMRERMEGVMMDNEGSGMGWLIKEVRKGA